MTPTPMNENTKRVLEADFAPETSFAVPTVACEFNLFEELRRRLVGQYLDAGAETADHTSIETAAREAAIEAWSTPFPLLMLPLLIEELVEKARRSEVLAMPQRDPAWFSCLAASAPVR